MRLFEFDEVDESLDLLPMAARRALDLVGSKLSLAGWKAQPLEFRRSLTALGSEDTVAVEAARALLEPLRAELRSIPSVAEPDPARPPSEVQRAFGPERPIPDASWAALAPVERYALWKIAASGRARRIERAYRELIGASALSSHLEPSGGVRMVNVGRKPETARRAAVESRVVMNEAAFERLRTHQVPKGDVLGTARLAGIMAAKKTAEWIPLCHPLRLTKVSIELELDQPGHAVVVRAVVEAWDRTGVEMEALVAASAAALTVYDMLKSFDRGMQIGPTRLIEKSGGRSGDFSAAMSAEGESMERSK